MACADHWIILIHVTVDNWVKAKSDGEKVNRIEKLPHLWANDRDGTSPSISCFPSVKIVSKEHLDDDGVYDAIHLLKLIKQHLEAFLILRERFHYSIAAHMVHVAFFELPKSWRSEFQVDF